MATEQSPAEFASVKIDDIIIGERAREVDADWVKTLATSFREGEMLNPVTLWRGEDGPVLVAGLHRIEAAKLNGDTHIDAKWSKAETLSDAEILETSENLLRNELTKLDRAHHLAVLKKAYEAKYPQAKKGGDKQTPEAREKLTDILAFSFDASEKTGLSDRQIRRDVKMWEDLSRASRAKLRGTWLADHQAGLTLLSKQEHPMQKEVLALLFPPEGKSSDVSTVPDAIAVVNDEKLLTPHEKIAKGFDRLMSKVNDEDLDAVLGEHQERILAWAKRILDGRKA